MANVARLTQSYPLKLPQETQLRQRVDWLQELGMQAAQQLLERLWTDSWLETLVASEQKAYKVIGEHQVHLRVNGQPLYLPSRIRRAIAEQVGRILRSQATRQKCYCAVLKIVQQVGVEGPLDSLVKIVGLTLAKFHGKYYRWAVIRQILRAFRRYYYRLGLDLTVLTQIPYTQMVSPIIKSFIFPYAPDDGQAIKLAPQPDSIAVRMKLPKMQLPRKIQDWG
ncbi:MAG: hypothetical protein ACE5OZ_20510 [Candidatus Heimdallarchaeota archaeon]